MPFNHMDQAAARRLARTDAAKTGPGEADVASAPWQEPRYGAEQRGLAGTVRAEQGHDLARTDSQRQVVQHIDLAVARLKRADVQQRFTLRDRH